MKKEMPKAYEPKQYEDAIYQRWEESGFFNPDNLEGTGGKYCNVLPPPNANGELHIGHASGYVVMDLIGRYQRMLGKKTLLLPGKDHAGIQSQVVYEKKIKKERNISRHDLGREKFYQEIYDFCIDRSKYMRNQEKKMGLSADWSREKFTLDPEIVNIVLETFVEMYNEVDSKGNRMIYRGERIINWCPRCASALADVEVEHEDTKAKLYTFHYSKDFPIAISTTRPETKLGDTAVAVNPDDERYQKYIGQIFELDFLGVPLKIKIIADREVDMKFGTGALGVTPAHSQIDWEMAANNDLDIIKVINEEGKINDGFGEFSGKPVLEARELIAERLKEAGLMKEEEIDNSLSVCERCKTTIEPLVSLQWFVNVDHENFSLKKEARKAIENGKIKIYPDKFKDIMLSWIDNVHDWCISRQIWWGPRIPAWYKDGEIKVCADSPGEGWEQDQDTFDTWFSSGQWAYTTLGYPEGEDYKEFYPSQNMIMGRDILPFWAFRMIILSLYRTRQAPFENLYFTGLVRDEKGQKMSKSKGNGIEPLEMIEKYGTDAVRLSLVIGSAPGNDMNLGEARIAGFRNLINKIWNISRFAITNYELRMMNDEINPENLTLADKYILGKMGELIKDVKADLEEYRFSSAGERLREFTWNDLADWYLEASKFEESENKDLILAKVLEDLLKLWHPFIPFVTEKIWEEIGKEKLLMVSEWPNEADYQKLDADKSKFELVREIIIAIRNARSENGVEPARKVKAVIYAGANQAWLGTQSELIKSLRTGIGELEIKESGEEIADAIYIPLGEIKIYLIGAVDKEKEKTRIEKEIKNLEKLVLSLEGKLSNREFKANAPKEIVGKEKEKLKDYQGKLEEFKNKIKKL